MGRKNSKVRQLDGLGLDFDDMFSGETSTSSTKVESSKSNPTERKVHVTKDQASPKGKEKAPPSTPSKPESTTRDLEQWLQQDEEFKRLQIEMETIKLAHQADRETWLQRQKDLEAKFATEKQSLQEQSVPLHEEVKRLEAELLAAKQQIAVEQEEIRVTKDELDRLKDTMERKAKTELEASDTVLLTSLLNERGLRTHGEYTSFYRAVGESQYSWGLWKDAVVPKELMQAFLSEQVHLVSESLRDTSAIPGVCIPVDNDKCELSGGVDLRAEMREIVTEVLLQGWNRVLILGVSKNFVNFVRHNLSKTTIEVQVDARGNQWSYNADMRNYPVIVIFGGGRNKIPQDCPSTVFCYDTTVFGQGLQQCRKSLSELSDN